MGVQCYPGAGWIYYLGEQALRIDVKTLLGHPVLTLTPKGVKYVLTPAEITVRTY